MIIKVTRLSRTKKNWESYVYLPDTYSFRSAVKHLERSKGLTTNKKVTYERVFDQNDLPKRVKHFDYNAKIYKFAK